MHVVVIGAGFIGIAITHALLDQGHKVTLIDRTGIAAGASRGNAGWIAHTDILPLASPKAWRHIPRWMFDPLGPLAIRPAYLPALLPWLLRFVAASRPSALDRSTQAIAALNGLALPAWHRRLQALGLMGHLRQRGGLSVWNNAADFRAFNTLADRQRSLGIDLTLLTATEMRDLEPAFGPSVVGGAFYPAICNVSDPAWLCQALGQAALSRGATLALGEVIALEPDGTVRLADSTTHQGERVVLAAGAWGKKLAGQLGDAVPLDTERGYNITLKPGALGLSRPVAFEGQGFVTTPLDSGDRIGGSVEFAGLHAAPNYARVDAIIGRLKRFIPTLPAMEGPRWMGFRPSIPDSLPVIGRARRSDKVLYAFGHGHYGLTQAAATAELVAAHIAGTPSPIDPTPYAPTRF